MIETIITNIILNMFIYKSHNREYTVAINTMYRFEVHNRYFA